MATMTEIGLGIRAEWATIMARRPIGCPSRESIDDCSVEYVKGCYTQIELGGGWSVMYFGDRDWMIQVGGTMYSHDGTWMTVEEGEELASGTW